MCQVCHHNPCLSACPNAGDPPAVAVCCECGEPINPGDEYAVIDGEAYCEYCLEDKPLCVLIPLCGGEWNTARLEDIPDGFDD